MDSSGRASDSDVFRQAIRGQRRSVMAGSVLTVIHQLSEVAVPVAIGLIIDQAVSTGDAAALTRWVPGLAGLFVVLSFAGCVGLYIEERAVTGATHEARLAVARRVLDPAGGVEDALPGKVVSLSTVETARIGEGVGAVILGLGALAGTIAGTATLLVTSLPLGAVVVVGLPALLLAVQHLSRPLTVRAEAHQEAVGSASGVAADLFSGLRVLKGLGAEAAATARYRRVSSTALGAALDANRVRSGYLGITLTAAGAFLALVAWIGGRQAAAGTISVGQLVAAVGITQFLVGPLSRLAYLASVVAQARASSNRVGAALAAPPAVRGGDERLLAVAEPEARAGATDGQGHQLVLDHVRHQALDDVHLAVDAGQIVGVVAADPAEAAALVACLDGTAQPAQGQVTVDGVPLGDLRLDEARRAVVVAHHDAYLFEGTLGANLAAAAPPEADLAPALMASATDEVLDTVPGGLEAAVTEGGKSLSGGQRQRVALGRALAVDPPVLVLHEPTTAVDAATEHRIAAGLRSLRSGRRTTLLVTTSPALLAVTDRVALLDRGRILAVGSHSDLATGEARYQRTVLS